MRTEKKLKVRVLLGVVVSDMYHNVFVLFYHYVFSI